MRDFDKSLPMQLLRAREAVMQHFRKGLAHQGLTEQQWRVLRSLHKYGQLDAKTISIECLILSASLSRILRKLQHEGFIKRISTKTDKRRTILELTTKGKKIIANHAPQSEGVYAMIDKKIGKRKIKQLLDMLAEMETKLK